MAESNFFDRMNDTGARVESLIWIPGICAEPTREFKDAISNDFPGDRELLAALPWLEKLIEDNDPESVLCELVWKKMEGFFVQLAHPIPQDFMKKGDGYTCSWGYYQTRWFYCATLDAIAETAAKFADAVVEAARAKQGKRKAPA